MYIQNRNTATTVNCTQAALQICCGGWLNSIEANMSSNMWIGTVQFHMSCSAPVVVPARAAKAATAANSAGSNACREKMMNNISPSQHKQHAQCVVWLLCRLHANSKCIPRHFAGGFINHQRYGGKNCCATDCS